MKKLIYYPAFEPTDETWIKYGLLFLERVYPIVPIRGRRKVSDSFRKLMDHTDLFKQIEVDILDSSNASTKAIIELESVVSAPQRYSHIMGLDNILEIWQNPVFWTAKLYREKYSTQFLSFCLDNGLAGESDEGVNISESLAAFYMTFLVNEISWRNNYMPITDEPRSNNMSTYLRSREIASRDMFYALRSTIQLYLPTDINNILVESIIDFRNRSQIQQLRNSLNTHFEMFYRGVEDAFTPMDYIRELKRINVEYIKEIVATFGTVTSIALIGTHILAHNQHDIFEYVLEFGAEVAGLTVSTIAFKQAWNADRHRRDARRFFTELSSLKF